MTQPTLHRLLFLGLFGIVLLSGRVQAERTTLNFNPDWKFIREDVPNAADPITDDSNWKTVSAPHTYNDVDTYDDFSLPGHKGELNQWAGKTWYRKTFTAPQSFTGKKIYIEFEGVRQIAEVYLNGQLLGVCKNGFVPFGFDLTPYLRVGEKNVLAVMCDNRYTHEVDMRAINSEGLPWNSPHWHPAHGGIYRNVRLYITDPLHISMPLYSFLQTEGPYVYGTGVTERRANLGVEVPVENNRPNLQEIEVEVEVFDRDNKSVLQMKQKAKLGGGEKKELKFAENNTIDRPQLWEPDFPYLYRVVCTLKSGGETVDSVEIPYGFRTVKFDLEKGFSINGQHLKLQGWGQKPTDEWPGLGAAQPDWMHYFTLQLMKEAGGNWVRWGHCPGGPSLIEAGDRLGILCEQPGCDGEGDAKGEAWTVRAAAFRDIIIYFRNNPSIVIWEGGNQKVIREHALELRGYMDKYDPNGGRSYAHRRADKVSAEFMDVGIGTEGGQEIKTLPVVEGEYNREESPRRVWDNYSPPNFGYPEAKGMSYWLTSEQFAVNQVRQYVRKIGEDFHCGGANWIFSDSTSGGRVPAEVCRASGEVDGVRLPKEAYWVCKVLFSDTPQIHIVGHWNYPSSTKKPVFVISNCPDIELSINGRVIPHGKPGDGYRFSFPDVTFEPGEIKAVAKINGKPVATDVRRTVGEPVALKMTAMSGPGGFFADGSDVALIDVEAVDADGNRCPTFEQRVEFDTNGPAIWRGGYNSGKMHSTNNTYLNLECGINRVAVRSTREAGDVTVNATSSGLRPASVTIKSLPVAVENGWTKQMPAMPQVQPKQPAAGEQLVLITPPHIDTSGQSGKFVKSLLYSGPTEGVEVVQAIKEGTKVYVDRDFTFANLPPQLRGADFVMASQGDSMYSALDFMELEVDTGVTVYIAHDDNLPIPDWMAKASPSAATQEPPFRATDMVLTIDGKPMKVYSHRSRREESLTLGSNTDDSEIKEGQMYIVFVNRAAGGGGGRGGRGGAATRNSSTQPGNRGRRGQ